MFITVIGAFVATECWAEMVRQLSRGVDHLFFTSDHPQSFGVFVVNQISFSQIGFPI